MGNSSQQRVEKATMSEQENLLHGHLVDLSVVETFDVPKSRYVPRGRQSEVSIKAEQSKKQRRRENSLGSDKVDCDTLSSETSTTTNPVDVVLAGRGEIVVDDKGNLLDIDTTGEEIGGDEDTGRSRSELLHDDLTLLLIHISVHGRDSELASLELVGKPVDLSSGVAEDDGLGDGDGLVKIGEGVELPFFLLDGDVELLDTFEGQFITLDENSDRVAHEFGGNLENVGGHGGREEDDLKKYNVSSASDAKDDIERIRT